MAFYAGGMLYATPAARAAAVSRSLSSAPGRRRRCRGAAAGGRAAAVAGRAGLAGPGAGTRCTCASSRLYFGLIVVSGSACRAPRSGDAGGRDRDGRCCARRRSAPVPVALAAPMPGSSRARRVYTITNRRVVMRIGLALPVTLNLPFARIDGGGPDADARRQRRHRAAARPGATGWPTSCCGRMPGRGAWPRRADAARRCRTRSRSAQILARALAASADMAVPVLERRGRGRCGLHARRPPTVARLTRDRRCRTRTASATVPRACRCSRSAAVVAAGARQRGRGRRARRRGRRADGPVVAERDLRFEDRADGAVVAVAAEHGRTVEVFEGEQRLPARHAARLRPRAPPRRSRRRRAVPPRRAGPTAGSPSTTRPTGRHVELLAFGPTNAGVFAALLEERRDERGCCSAARTVRGHAPTSTSRRRAESFHAYAVPDGIDIRPGDVVVVHGVPTDIGFGERLVMQCQATVTRAGPLLRGCGPSFTAMFELTELYEVGFMPKETP